MTGLMKAGQKIQHILFDFVHRINRPTIIRQTTKCFVGIFAIFAIVLSEAFFAALDQL